MSGRVRWWAEKERRALVLCVKRRRVERWDMVNQEGLLAVVL